MGSNLRLSYLACFIPTPDTEDQDIVQTDDTETTGETTVLTARETDTGSGVPGRVGETTTGRGAGAGRGRSTGSTTRTATETGREETRESAVNQDLLNPESKRSQEETRTG